MRRLFISSCTDSAKLVFMQNNGKKLLQSSPASNSQQKRPTVSSAASITNITTTAMSTHTIDTNLTFAQYKKFIDDQVGAAASDKESKANYQKIAPVARDVIWQLLFSRQPASAEDQAKAAEFLVELKSDACFYQPYEYNEWIVRVRDELLKREMLDFWRDQIVKKELGPCWSKDSDFFDDAEDPEPAEFYNRAGSAAPFAKKRGEAEGRSGSDNGLNVMNASCGIVVPPLSSCTAGGAARTVSATEPFEATISAENALSDYKRLMDEKVLVDEYVPEETLQENFRKIATSMRDIIWQLLFSGAGNEPASQPAQDKAADLLKAYRMDARFHSPWEYNRWIVLVRDELLKREMVNFWRDVIVRHELGLCWARDCDYFDEIDDPEPIEFYKKAGCVAPFSTNDGES